MHQLTSVDAQFLAAEDGRVHGHVTSLALYDGPLSAQDVRAIVTARIHLLAPFCERLVRVPLDLDLPYWAEDPDFDVADHVHAHTLPAPAGDDELAAFTGTLMSRPMDFGRPLWAIHVIGGLASGRMAVATQMHHSISDGLGMGQMFAILHDPTVDVRDLGSESASAGPLPGRVEMLARGAVGLARQPLRFLRSFPRALPHLDQIVTLRPIPGVNQAAAAGRRVTRLMSANDDGEVLEATTRLAPRTATTGPISGERTVAFTTTSLEEVRAVKQHFGVTLNDVVMTIVAGALRSWLDGRGELPAEPLAAMVPISVRAPAQAGTFGNRVAMMIPPVFTDEPDPATRLQRTHEAMRAAKDRHRAVPATLLQDANHFIPPALLARAARALALVASSPRRGAAANLAVSNVPGPRDPQFLGGARQVAFYPLSAIFHGLGLNITVVSSGDQLDWGIVGDPEQIGEASALVDCLVAAQAEAVALTVSHQPRRDCSQ